MSGLRLTLSCSRAAEGGVGSPPFVSVSPFLRVNPFAPSGAVIGGTTTGKVQVFTPTP